MAETAPTVQGTVLEEVGVLLRPLRILETGEGTTSLLRDMGWDFPAATAFPGRFEELLAALGRTQQAVYDLQNAQTSEEQLERLGDLLNEAEGVAERAWDLGVAMREALGSLPDFRDKSDLEIDLPPRLVDYLVGRYLAERQPLVEAVAVLLGLMEWVHVPAEPGRYRLETILPKIHWDRIPRLFASPLQVADEAYAWLSEFDSSRFLAALFVTLGRLGFTGGTFQQDVRVSEALGRPVGDRAELKVPLFQTTAPGDVLMEGGLRLCDVPAQAQDRRGLVVLPYIIGSAGAQVDLESGWELTFASTLSLSQGVALVLRPPTRFTVQADLLSAPTVPADADVRLLLTRRSTPGETLLLIGAPERSRVMMSGLAVGLHAQKMGQRLELAIDVELDELSAVVTADGRDGFLAQILPAEGLGSQFDLAISLSSSRGLHVRGSPGLEATLPVALGVGGLVELRSIFVRVAGEDGTLVAAVAVTGTLRLGPVTATVDRVGLKANASVREDGSGNLGPLDARLHPLPPRGVALSIDAGSVTGGGFLFFDEAKAQYAGALHLEFEGLTLNAIGLLTTRLPGGRSGFSLVVLVSAAGFEPIQLGFGFTLNRVGGLLGVNRTAALEPLTARFNDGSLSPLLFSDEDPVPRADAIVSALDQVFPPAADRFVFGPMARIGWGTPPLVTLDVALLLELPAPVRLIVIGELAAVLPRPENPLVELHMDVLGVVDFDRRTASVDARLRDSRILEFALTGAMALRASWGEQPAFVLAVGGLHPRFRRPPDFPQLERVALTLVSGEDPPVASPDTPRLRLEAYLALTSNTIQLGARAELAVRVGRFGIEGQLAFDTLVQLEPFEFVAEIAATLAIKSDSSLLCAIDVAVTLTGPAPWHVRGTATLQILFFKASVGPFDLTFGARRDDELPPPIVDLWSLLEPELRKPANWTAALPDGGSQMVTLAAAFPPPAGEPLVHPLGSLTLSQRTVPLDTDITRFGGARVGGLRRFSVTSAAFGGRSVVKPPPTTEYFARAQFQDMGDEEKLAAPSFERLASGVRLVAGDTVAGPAVTAPIGYEDVILEREGEPRAEPQPEPYAMPQADVDAVARFGPAATAAVRTTGRERYRAPGQPIAADDGSYRLAWSDRLKPVEVLDAADGTYANAAGARDRFLRAHPDQRGQIQIVREHELV